MDKFGVVFIGKSRAPLLLVLSMLVILNMLSSVWQLLAAYLAGDGFDVTIRAFWLITLLLFLPYFLTGAYVIRSLIARVIFYRLVKKQIVIPEYQPTATLTAAEAGLLIDNTFGLPEIAAVLKDLELGGYVKLGITSFTFTISYVTTEGLDEPYLTFVRSLFASSDEVAVSFSTRELLLHASNTLGKTVRSQLINEGQLSPNTWITKAAHALFHVFWVVAAIVQSVWIIALIADYHQVFDIGYPRYPMSISEPALLLSISLAAIIIIGSAFRQQTLTTNGGLKSWRYVAGLRVYIETVYKGHFYRDGVEGTTDSELRTYYPYAIALGVETNFTERLKRALLST